jgi:hypothetical protein
LRAAVLELTLHHDIHCSAERFWELHFDPAFVKEMIVDGLGFASCDVGPVVEDGHFRKRETRVIPKIDVPAAVAKLLGPKLGYVEKGKLDTRTQAWTYEIVLSVLSDRIKMGGTMTVLPADDAKCKRTSVLWVDVRIFGVGGLVERAAESNMKSGWNRSAEWMNEYLARPPRP